MNPALGLAIAVTFGWLGMLLAISFLETPLKFRAPGVTVPIGVGIGRLVFRALNMVEIVLAALLLTASIIGAPSRRAIASVVCVIAVLLVQVFIVRPRLNRRSDRVLAGEELPHSGGHHLYIALETAKIAVLAITGALMLAS